jgi:hypothetical protein
MMENDRILNIAEATQLATIIGWAQRCAKLVWLDERSDVCYGTARSIGDENGNFLRCDRDVRDAYLRITTVGGFDLFLPMSEVLRRHDLGTMMEERHRNG